MTRAPSLLAPAVGFLLVALMTAPQLLRESQGAFIDLRLLFIADLALPAAVIAYALLRKTAAAVVDPERVGIHVTGAMAATVTLAALTTWLTAASNDPGTGVPAVEASFTWRALTTLALCTTLAAAVGLLWRRRSSVLDLWLLVALTAWSMDVVLRAATPDDSSVAWHCARLCGVLGVGCLVFVLLSENASVLARFERLLTATRNRHPGTDGVVDGIAEELNQPLCAITANADAITRLLEREPPDLDEVRAALADIVSDAGRASDTLRQAQRLVATTHEPPAMIDVGQLVGECLEHLRADLLTQRVTCEVETAAQLPGVRGVRRQLLQMLVNLVTNSMEALSGVQHRERRLRVRAGRHGDAVAIWIEDSGVGILPRAQLRLAWCRSIVTAHGGQLSAAADEGGAAFRVLLPANS